MNELALKERKTLEVYMDEEGKPYTTTYDIHLFTGKPHANIFRSALTYLPRLGVDLTKHTESYKRPQGGAEVSILRVPLHVSVALICKIDMTSGAEVAEQLLATGGPISTQNSLPVELPQADPVGDTKSIEILLEYMERRFSAMESRLMTNAPLTLPAPVYRACITEGISEDACLSVSEIGHILGTSGHQINKLFIDLGFQTKVGLVYRPTRRVDGLYEVTKTSGRSSTKRIDRFRWKKEILNRVPADHFK